MARSVDEILALRDVWPDGPNLAASLDFFLTVVREREPEARPHVVVVSQNGGVVAMLVARTERLAIRCRVGYWTLIEPKLETIVVSQGGFMGDPSAATTAMECLRRSVTAREAEAIYMPGLRVGSPLQLAAGDLRGLRRQRGIEETMHYGLDLPPTFDQYLRERFSRKARGNLRRAGQRLERAFPDAVRVMRYVDPADYDEAIAAMQEISAKTYQRSIGAGFEADALDRGLVRTTMANGQFEAHVLYIADEPVAFWQAYVGGGVLRLGYTGFDPAFGTYEVGTYTLLRLIEACCDNPAVSSIDFGTGEADYKRRFGNTSWQDTDVFFFGPGARPALVTAARSATTEVNDVLVFLVRRSTAMRRLKRWLRQRRSGS